MTSSEDVNIILDLDNTVICSERSQRFPKKFLNKVKMFKSHKLDDEFIVFERPHLQEFLDFLFANFNVLVWTAASRDYALFVAKKALLAKKGRQLKYIFYEDHCNDSREHYNSPKDIRLIRDIYGIPGIDESNTIIIDDYDKVKDAQINNCVLIKPFEFRENGSEDDTTLLDLRAELQTLK